MKIKIEFITNSSSASFTILKKNLSTIQVDLIKNHIRESNNFLIHRGPQHELFNSPGDAWHIIETEDSIEGDTSMDNFNMHWFLKKIGIDDQHIKFDDHPNY